MTAHLETIAKGDDSALVEARRFLIRDPQSFSAVWAAHAGPEAPLPSVDFGTRMVAAVFAGERPTTGYQIAVTGTTRQESTVIVDVEEQQPNASDVTAQIIVSPFHIVSLPREDGDVRFSAADGDAANPRTTIVFKSQTPRAESQGAAAETESARRGLRESDWLRERSSSTGLAPEVAAAMAYMAGPFSAALLLATEQTSRFVRFHALQALFGLGVLGSVALLFLMMAFVFLLVSPTAFWAMLWLAALTGATWVVVWALCLRHAYLGQIWKLPVAGDYAERYVGL